MRFRVWGKNSIKNHSLTFFRQLIYAWNLDLTRFSYLPSLPDKFFSFAIVLFGGSTRAKNVQLLGQIQMASCLTEAWWFLDSKPDRNMPLWSQKWKGVLLQNTRIQRNGRQLLREHPSRLRTSWFCGTNLQIQRLLRQKITLYCGIDLQTSMALRNINRFLNGSKMEKPLRTATPPCARGESGFRVIKLGCYVVDIGCICHVINEWSHKDFKKYKTPRIVSLGHLWGNSVIRRHWRSISEIWTMQTFAYI